MAAEPGALSEALNILLPLLGGGGVTAIVVAYFGYRKGAPKEKAEAPAFSFAALYADRIAIDRMADALERNTNANLRQAEASDRVAAAIEGNSHAQNREADALDRAGEALHRVANSMRAPFALPPSPAPAPRSRRRK